MFFISFLPTSDSGPVVISGGYYGMWVVYLVRLEGITLLMGRNVFFGGSI